MYNRCYDIENGSFDWSDFWRLEDQQTELDELGKIDRIMEGSYND